MAHMVVARVSSAPCKASGSRRSAVRAQSKAQQEADLRQTVAIVGAGIAGLASAVSLERQGFQCLVLERSETRREGGTAIALWKNAWRALDYLGVGDELRNGNHPELDSVELCAAEGGILKRFSFDECNGGPHEFRGVFRGELLRALESKLEQTEIRYGVGVERVTTTETGTGGVVLRTEGGEEMRCLAAVGSNGASSGLCGLPPTNYAGYRAIRGVANFEGEMPLPSSTVRQVLGRGMRAGMYPISDREVYWFVCFNGAEGDGPPMERALEAFRSWGHGVREVIEATAVEDMVASSIRDRWQSPLAPVGRGNLTLAGDALHPMTPNLGQGGCCALEDAVVLGRRLGGAAGGEGMAAALRSYEAERLRRTLKLTVRAGVMGSLLQIDNPLVTAARDAVVSRAFDPSSFLDHTSYDCREA
ncbi:monooxygenase [Chloropicon roscoffensis]|uniref:Monooxygenase n=1 Tax=Chloropicon roscoffensis TaxID=1461544 RepID=A0AAX4PC28_9CHLO